MLRLTEANSTFTLLQSHSSSSASSMGRPEPVPCPISAIGQRRITVSSGSITTQALTSRGSALSAAQLCLANSAAYPGKLRPTSNPPEAVAALMTKRRRVKVFVMALHLSRGAMDGAADTHIGAAAADIARHRRVNVGIVGIGRAVQKRGGRHDLAGLAIAALRHVFRDPGLLHLVQLAVLRKAFDGGDGVPLGA